MVTSDYESRHETGTPAGGRVHRNPHSWIKRTRGCVPGAEGPRLTAADHTPPDRAVAQQTRTEDPQTASQSVGMGDRPRLWNQLLENPLLSLFGAMIVMLLGYVLTTSNIRITETNERITRLDNRIEDRFNRFESRIENRFNGIEDRLNGIEDRIIRNDIKIEDRFVRIESRVGSLEGSVSEVDRKLTALIAALGKTDEVEGALTDNAYGTRTGRLLDDASNS